MESEVSSDSGVGSDAVSEISDFHFFTPQNTAHLINKRRKRMRKGKPAGKTHSSSAISPTIGQDSGDECAKIVDDASNHRHLLISSAKATLERLLNVVSALRRRCVFSSNSKEIEENNVLNERDKKREQCEKASNYNDKEQKNFCIENEEIKGKEMWMKGEFLKKSVTSSKHAVRIWPLIAIAFLILSLKFIDIKQNKCSNNKKSLNLENTKFTGIVKKTALVRKDLNNFFNSFTDQLLMNLAEPLISKWRWRGDLELLKFARKDGDKHLNIDIRNGERQINMLLTEQPLSSSTTGASNLSVSSPFQSQFSGNSPGSRVVDPSLIDYEAIDVYWRRDIEQEKGVRFSSVQPLQTTFISNISPTAVDAEVDQFERDLQLLTEKSLSVELNREERIRYEELSKAYYTDFYRNVERKEKENVLPTTSYAAPSYCSSPFSSNGECSSSSISFFPSTYSVPSSSKNTPCVESARHSNFPSWKVDDCDCKTVKDDFLVAEEIRDFNKAKNVDVSSPLPENVNFHSGSGAGCGFDAILLNNVSLFDATCEPLTGDVTEFFNFNNLDAVIKEEDSTFSASSSLKAVIEKSDGSDEHNSVSSPFTEFFDEGFGESLDDFISANTLLDLASLQVDPLQENVGNNENEGDPSSNILESTRSRYESTGTPSSSGMLSASSPIYSHEEFSTHSSDVESRFCNKLVPSETTFFCVEMENEKDAYVGDHDYYIAQQEHKRMPQGRVAEIECFSEETSVLRRGRRSKDEELAMAYNLPASANEITQMSHAQVQHILRSPHFSPTQKALVKKIRRRGRNKVAARKCRERRINSELPDNSNQLSKNLRQFNKLSMNTPSTSRQAAIFESYVTHSIKNQGSFHRSFYQDPAMMASYDNFDGFEDEFNENY